MIERLPWRYAWWQTKCRARLDNGRGCHLIRHGHRIAHAHREGETVIRWSVVTWVERTIDHS